MNTVPKRARLVPQQDGTQPDEVVHISSFVLVRKGVQLLLLRRQKPERMAGSWVLPSGVINYGEDPRQAALRMTGEQLGIPPTSLKLVDVQSYGDRHWDLCFMYSAEVPNVGAPGGDFDKAEYFDLDALPAQLSEGNREVLDMLRSRRII